jgi:hypothetical protein
MSRIFKYYVVPLLAVISAIFVSGLIISVFYQEEVRELMIGEINKHVNTEIRVKEMKFSVLRKFPRASVEFRDVVIMVPEDYKRTGTGGFDSDTLFFAQNLFLQFNLRDIFNKRYRVTGLNARNGVLYLATNSEGQVNYRFWKTPDSSPDDFEFDLQNVRLSGYRFQFGNHLKGMFLDSDMRRIEMKGNFSRSVNHISGMLQGTRLEFTHQEFSYSDDQDFSLRALLNVSENLISIGQGTVDISGIRLLASGEYESENGNINMEFTGENLDIASFIDLLPSTTRKELDKYRFDGKFDFDAAVTGSLAGTNTPSINAGFTTRRGVVQRKDTGVRLREINLKGEYSNGSRQSAQTSKIAISNFSCVFGKGSITGSAGISNLTRPLINFDINASFLLEELAGFYQPANILQMAGTVRTELSGRGQLERFVMPGIRELNSMELDGYLEIGDGVMEVFEGRYIASLINGELYFGRRIRTPGLSFNVGSDHFLIEGEIDNGLPWLLGDDITMSISGSLYSENLNIDNYLETRSPGDPVQEGESEKLLLPRNLELSLDFLIENLDFRKFNSSGFTGKLSYKPYMLTINTVDFNSMEGSVNGNGVIVQRVNGDFIVQSRLQLQNVDMQNMFLTFNNFGQTFIHGENLKGRLSGNLSFISEWDRELKLKSEQIVADSKVEIRSGELIDFEPMLGLARYIDVDELRHIRFSTLHNEIFIRNKLVTIPQMDINSSAINITGSGTHHFNGQFDYRLRLNLSDVLYGRSTRSRPENTKYGIVEDDGLGRTSLHLRVSGTSDDYSVSYDHRAVREVIRNNIANERNVLRQLLHDEFGWFRSDSTLKENPDAGTSAGRGFRITWDEEDENNVSPPGTPAPAGSSQPAGGNQPAGSNDPAGTSNKPAERKFEIIWEEGENPY